MELLLQSKEEFCLKNLHVSFRAMK